MKSARVLVTGPVGELDEWCAAARGVGWEAIPWPLIVIAELAPEPAFAFVVPEHLCITSAHAVGFLEELAVREPALRALPCSIVGERSVSRLRALGFRGEIEWFASAELLGAELCARAPRPTRVLWPRGDKSEELARVLRAADMTVDDPIAYTNRPRAADEQPPECELVFFASPSAVRAWSDAFAEHPVQRALAIGSTTFQALLSGKSLPFSDIISLPEPTSSSFAVALQHIDLRPTP